MPEPPQNWQIQPPIHPPAWLVEAIKHHAPELRGHYAASVLISRGIKNPEQISGFLNPNLYQPASPFEFGQEMNLAIDRILQARNNAENIAIWGDFDADGITSTSVLWDGLGQFFSKNDQLTYYIPNRLTESHGLNNPGIDTLAKSGINLIITCDTGSTNLAEIDYARSLGIDIIVTDHHTLPEQRPQVVAIINPRYLPSTHQLFHLSGVAVAYKLIEALYQTLPDVPQRPLEDLLVLVAIGLIADLVQLTGDCRYLAQKGIECLGEQIVNPTRPGIAKLLELCKRSGDRPTDISFGIGPRINAVSRIQGDASFCVELLTNRNTKRCNELALLTELANTRRKSIQKDTVRDVTEKLAKIDLSTTSVIVLSDPQWPVGVLGLVAGQIAQKYGRPTILLSTEEAGERGSEGDAEFLSRGDGEQLPITNYQLPIAKDPILARGSARSVSQIDLYKLVKSQAHLLHRFGGHPFAAGLSLPVENIPLFTDAINQQLRGIMVNGLPPIVIQAELIVTVSELGRELFQELKLLEPCGMGNPAPKLLIKNCWFENTWNENQKDLKGNKVQYIKTTFEIKDNSTERAFPGIWWEHYRDEIPKFPCDAIVELDYNTYQKYHVRLIALRPNSDNDPVNIPAQIDWILDWRNSQNQNESPIPISPSPLIISECPTSWGELQAWFRRGLHSQQKIAIAYTRPPSPPPIQIWQELVGIAKHLTHTSQTVTRRQLKQKLGISDVSLQLGFKTLTHLGFKITYRDRAFHIARHPLEKQSETLSHPTHSQQLSISHSEALSHSIQQFLAVVSEEQFRRRYFCEVSFATIQAMAQETVLNDLDSPGTPF
ncbi:DHH family phosphoesterase [Kamptonema sp. UHCC 0994]|uniref:single-stranded-DNA-specific exonuclease RecJ n=1 Tax=Kamptonema sp. UHCC 0994 TaxID=3031329 RepID=UPI0023B90755|nr:DHH family phosphoesterase [Kamptonema sp. UHCC 0994]MDF0551985.1 DHH family phosphoesterase [Kamptonema sp. UHCC 0994]